jgi:hypothetical protein
VKLCVPFPASEDDGKNKRAAPIISKTADKIKYVLFIVHLLYGTI